MQAWLVAQTLCNPKDCSLPGSSVQGVLQARILCVAILSPVRLLNQGLEPASLTSPALAGEFFITSTIREMTAQDP